MYYNSLDLPVLLVLYHAPSRTLYAHWFHSYDPYYGGTTKSAIRVKLPSDGMWNVDTQARLLADLKVIKALKLRAQETPVRVGITFQENNLHERPKSEIVLSMQAKVAPFGDVVQLVASSDPGEQPWQVLMQQDRTAVVIAGFGATTIHHKGGYSRAEGSSAIAANTLLALASAFLRVGITAPAARLAVEAAAEATLLEDWQVASNIAGALRRGHYVLEALRLAQSIRERGTAESRATADLLSLVGLLGTESLSEAELRASEQYLEAAVADAFNTPQGVARAHYNLGSFYRSRRSWWPALQQYNRAAEVDETYLGRAYFRRERGGIYFLLTLYEEAAQEYEAVLAHPSPDDDVTPLLADARMYCGQYRTARDLFASHLDDRTIDDRELEWLLKLIALDWLVNQFGVDRQTRNTDAAIELSAEPAAGETPTSARARYIAALHEDALWGSSWYNFAATMQNLQEPDDQQFYAWLLAALADLTQPDAWVNATLSGIRTAEPPVVAAVVLTAHRLVGPDYLLAFIAESQDWPESFREAALHSVSSLIEQSVDEKSPTHLRLVDNSGRVRGVEEY